MDLESIKRDLQQVETKLVAAIHQADDADTILDLHSYLSAVAAKVRHWQSLIEQRFIEHIQDHGEVSDGQTRYYVGTARTTRPIDPAAVLETCLDLAAGDVKAVAGFLAAGAFKYGAVKAALEEAGQGDRFSTLFATEEKLDLKTGKPVQEIRSAEG